MDFELVVTQPFGERAIGDVISDDEGVKTVMQSNPHSIVKRTKAAPAAPDKVSAKPTAGDPVKQ